MRKMIIDFDIENVNFNKICVMNYNDFKELKKIVNASSDKELKNKINKKVNIKLYNFQ
jgi:hypothetical protein